MRVLHVLDHSLPLQSGYVYRTLGIVNQQRLFGWEPILLTSGKHYAPGPPREQVNGWEFLRTPAPAGLISRVPAVRELKIISDLRRRLDELIVEMRPDILHAHSPALNGLPSVQIGARRGIPVVYEIRAFWEDARASARPDGGGLRYRIVRGLETYTAKRSDAVVTICQGLATDIIARGIPNEKVTIVPNAVDRKAFSGPAPADPELLRRLGLIGRTIIGFFGSFYRYEGLHILLRALPELRRQRPELAVLLVGGGPEAADLRELTHQLGVEDAVVFVGRVPHEQIKAYYDLADLFVFPRLSMRLTELVTPLKPLEAMAQERIVLASNVGGHRELVRHGDTGYLFSPDRSDKLAAAVFDALNDRSSWPRIRERALQFVDTERSWATSVSFYKEVYARAESWRSRTHNF